MKVFMNGFFGPWGWVVDYKRSRPFITENIDEADIIFQADTSNYELAQKYLGKKNVIGVILDFADWYNGEKSPSILKYANEFLSMCDVRLAISSDVMDKCSMIYIDTKMFYYPSQVTKEIISTIGSIPKNNNRKQILTFCRLSDPGKRVKEAVECFHESDIASLGWTYGLIGPEGVNFKLPKGVQSFGYVDTQTLYTMVRLSRFTLMPSIGEGLGLPAIESILMGTKPIVRLISPMDDMLYENDVIFFEDEKSLVDVLGGLDNENIECNSEKYSHWIRDIAFEKIDNLLEELYNDQS